MVFDLTVELPKEDDVNDGGDDDGGDGGGVEEIEEDGLAEVG